MNLQKLKSHHLLTVSWKAQYDSDKFLCPHKSGVDSVRIGARRLFANNPTLCIQMELETPRGRSVKSKGSRNRNWYERGPHRANKRIYSWSLSTNAVTQLGRVFYGNNQKIYFWCRCGWRRSCFWRRETRWRKQGWTYKQSRQTYSMNSYPVYSRLSCDMQLMLSFLVVSLLCLTHICLHPKIFLLNVPIPYLFVTYSLCTSMLQTVLKNRPPKWFFRHGWYQHFRHILLIAIIVM